MTQNEDSDRIEFREFKLEEFPDGRCHPLVVLTMSAPLKRKTRTQDATGAPPKPLP